MSSPAGSVRNRKKVEVPIKKDATITSNGVSRDADLDALVRTKLNSKRSGSEWDYKVALAIITALAFITRFWGISHPNEVVFDEVHFGKVSLLKHIA